MKPAILLATAAVSAAAAACLPGCQAKPAIDGRALDKMAATLSLDKFDGGAFPGKVMPCATDEQAATSYFGLMKAAARDDSLELVGYAFRAIRLKDGPGKLGAIRLSMRGPPGSARESEVSAYTEYFLINPQCRAMFLTKSLD